MEQSLNLMTELNEVSILYHIGMKLNYENLNCEKKLEFEKSSELSKSKNNAKRRNLQRQKQKNAP